MADALVVDVGERDALRESDASDDAERDCKFDVVSDARAVAELVAVAVFDDVVDAEIDGVSDLDFVDAALRDDDAVEVGEAVEVDDSVDDADSEDVADDDAVAVVDAVADPVTVNVSEVVGLFDERLAVAFALFDGVVDDRAEDVGEGDVDGVTT